MKSLCDFYHSSVSQENEGHNLSADQKSRLLSRWAIFLTSVCLGAFKNYSLWANPRFYAEEGRVYFANAYRHGTWQTLLAPHQGYYSLWTNLSTLISAKLFPLHTAPLITQLAGLFSIAITLSIITSSQLRILAGLRTKLLVALAVVLVDGGDGLVLTSLSAQFHFGIVGLILMAELFEQESTQRPLMITLLVLTLAALSSPLVCLLFPFFLVAFFNNRTRLSRLSLTIIVICAFLQFIASQVEIDSTPTYLGDRLSLASRLLGLDFNLTLPNVLIQGCLSPFLPRSQAIYLGFHAVYLSQESPMLLAFLNLLLLAALIGGTRAYIQSNRHRGPLVLLLASFFFILCGSVLGFNDMKTQLMVGQAPRYLYCSTILLLILVVSMIDWTWKRKLMNLLLLGLLLLPIYKGIERIRTDQSANQEWSDWQAECVKHVQDPHLGLRIWPRPWIILVDEWDYSQPFDGRPVAESLALKASGDGDTSGLPSLSCTPPVMGKDMNVTVTSKRPNTPGSLLWYQGKAKRSKIGLPGNQKLNLFVPQKFAEQNRINFTTNAEGTWTHTFPMSDFYFRRNWYFCYQAVLAGPPIETTNAIQTKVGY